MLHTAQIYHEKKILLLQRITSKFKAKRLGKGKKTTHNVIVKPQVSGIYN